MELFAKRMTWELDNAEGLSSLSFEWEDGCFTLSRKTGVKMLRLEMNDPANSQLIDPDCLEYAFDDTSFRLNIVQNNRKVPAVFGRASHQHGTVWGNRSSLCLSHQART